MRKALGYFGVALALLCFLYLFYSLNRSKTNRLETISLECIPLFRFRSEPSFYEFSDKYSTHHKNTIGTYIYQLQQCFEENDLEIQKNVLFALTRAGKNYKVSTDKIHDIEDELIPNPIYQAFHSKYTCRIPGIRKSTSIKQQPEVNSAYKQIFASETWSLYGYVEYARHP